MSTEEKVVSIAGAGAEPSPALYVKFKKPYVFEDETFEGIDLGGLENLTARDMAKAQRAMERTGSVSATPELTMEYACNIASTATGYPVEFFEGLPLREGVKVKNRIVNFIYGQD